MGEPRDGEVFPVFRPERREAQFEQFKRELDVATARIGSARVIAHALIAGRRASMSITGADSFAATLRERLAASKKKIGGLHERMNAVVARGETVSGMAEEIVKAAETEVAALEGELRQLSNFPPES